MQDVNIYIETSFHGPSRKNGTYLYILECIKEGIPITRDGMGDLERITENQLALTALLAALERIVCPCELRIHTSCQHIINSMQNGWARQWQKNAWRTAKGAEVKNSELWNRVLNHLDRHLYTFTDEYHSYRTWMEQMLAERRRNGAT